MNHTEAVRKFICARTSFQYKSHKHFSKYISLKHYYPYSCSDQSIFHLINSDIPLYFYFFCFTINKLKFYYSNK